MVQMLERPFADSLEAIAVYKLGHIGGSLTTLRDDIDESLGGPVERTGGTWRQSLAKSRRFRSMGRSGDWVHARVRSD